MNPAQEPRNGKAPVRRDRLPVLPLRDMVVFPGTIVTLLVGRGKSLSALEYALLNDRVILTVAQKDAAVDNPGAADLYEIGTCAEVLQVVKMLHGAGVRVLVEGLFRCRVPEYTPGASFLTARVTEIAETRPKGPEVEALARGVLDQFDRYVKVNRKLPPETLLSVTHIEDGGRLADTLAAQVQLKLEEKQKLLELADGGERLSKLAELLSREIELLDLERRIHGRVKRQIEQSQREYYLNEQMKAIQRELGQREDPATEAAELRRKVDAAAMSSEARSKARREVDRIERMMPLSAEATVARTYVEWLLAMPWKKRTRDQLDLTRVQRVLDEDHYGLDKVKERVVEYMAVQRLLRRPGEKAAADGHAAPKGSILCFVGPPGVGKTSLGRSIARAVGRRFVRVSLGGVRDEAEIRGHRRTYIGAMPGKIVQGMRKAASANPIFLLDEIDKLGLDFRGDPASALLEVLDPEQNRAFNDHYLDVDLDLSQVFFITTANSLHPVPPALLDRLEVIHLPGYTDLEKLEIARRFLVPKQRRAHGLRDSEFGIDDEALADLLARYTRESGVRNLEREISTLCRKVARRIVGGEEGAVSVGPGDLVRWLGAPKFRKESFAEVNGVGVATGLAFTETGGEPLAIEVTLVRGRGQVQVTGKLGDVMKESAQAALSFARSLVPLPRAIDLHIHVPEGAVPKDGPSAGITMAVAVLSALTARPVRKGVAMTGEVTLRGRVLPVGGLKAKLLAAYRTGIHTVLVPKENEKDLDEVPAEVRARVRIVPVADMEEVLPLALEESAVPAARPGAADPYASLPAALS